MEEIYFRQEIYLNEFSGLGFRPNKPRAILILMISNLLQRNKNGYRFFFFLKSRQARALVILHIIGSINPAGESWAYPFIRKPAGG